MSTFAGGGDGVDAVSGYSDGTGTEAYFSAPHSITIDSMGMLYVTEWTNQLIRKITPAGYCKYY